MNKQQWAQHHGFPDWFMDQLTQALKTVKGKITKVGGSNEKETKDIKEDM